MHKVDAIFCQPRTEIHTRLTVDDLRDIGSIGANHRRQLRYVEVLIGVGTLGLHNFHNALIKLLGRLGNIAFRKFLDLLFCLIQLDSCIIVNAPQNPEGAGDAQYHTYHRQQQQEQAQ